MASKGGKKEKRTRENRSASVVEVNLKNDTKKSARLK